MPSNKEKVASYLDIDETAALDEFCKENDYSRSQGVIHLIRNYLIEVDDAKHTIAGFDNYEGRMQVLEDGLFVALKLAQQTARKNEKLEECITALQCEVDTLKKVVKKQPPRRYTDDEIASVTGRRVQEVYEWRLGIRKPRGEKILGKLRYFVIVDGQWRKKIDLENSESVVENVVEF